MSDDCELSDLKEKVRRLESKLFLSDACQIHRLHLADEEVAKLTTSRFMGSEIILTVHGLGGEELVSPVMIRGLSDETIDGLRKDLARTFEHGTELRPGFAAKDKESTGK